MLEKMKKFLDKLNSRGIPLPTIRDPKNGRGSITLTMFWISFNISILTLAGKITNVIGDIDYSNVLWLLGITGGMYMGRRFQSDKNGISVEGTNNEEETK